MIFPFECPVCKNRGELDNTIHDYENGMKDELYVCARCDSEWKVPYVVVEKIITWDGRAGRETS